MEIWALKKGNVDVGVLQEKNITKGIHTSYGAGHVVWEMEAESRHWGVVVVVWREEAGWQVEGIVNFGPNMAIFLLCQVHGDGTSLENTCP